FNNDGVPELTGADMATPLLFDLFNTLDYNSPNQWYRPTEDLDFRLVCSESGQPSGEFCEHAVLDQYLPGVSSMQACTHLREVAVAPAEAISYCTRCRPPTGFRRELYPDYPADLLAWFDRVGVRYKKIPPHNPACPRVFAD